MAAMFNHFLLNRRSPVVLEDVYGVRFILYPWNRGDLKNLLSRPSNKVQFMTGRRRSLRAELLKGKVFESKSAISMIRISKNVWILLIGMFLVVSI